MVYKNRQNLNDQFVIITTYEDSLTIQESINFKRLEKIFYVEFLLIDGLIDTSNSHAAMSECYSLAMQRECVTSFQTYFVFLTPDSFWSDGAFARLLELASQGVQVVASIGFRVNAESMSLILEEHIKQSPTNYAIPYGCLIKLVIENIHQLSSAHNWLSKNSFLNVWPSHIYWIDKRQSILIAHCFHLHPLMVLAPDKNTKIGTTIDGEFLDNLNYPLSGYYVVQKEFFGVELSPAARSWGQPLASPSIYAVLKFAKSHANKRHWFFFEKRIVLSPGSDDAIAPELLNLAACIVGKIKKEERRLLFLRAVETSFPGRLLSKMKFHYFRITYGIKSAFERFKILLKALLFRRQLND